jgi:cellulose synthase/poly-beta-1,6-N-acetylglucosamine synthase-like glycosyltransferase
MTKLDTKYEMISIIITSFNEPKTIGKAIESFLDQNIKENYELYIAAPDKETHEIVKKYQNKNKKIKLFIDPGKGKSYAINLLLPKLKGEIIILSDGDVYVSENSIKELIKPFENSKTGCVTGQPISIENKNTILGYWSHLLCNAAHKLRERRHKQKKFLECSGYLWAFRNKIIKKFPLDVGEDTIVPIMFYRKNYEIKYSPKAKVYVKYPEKIKEFFKQKRRTAGAHDNISKYVNQKKIPKMKSFKNETFGTLQVLTYSKNIKELSWTFLLFPIRAYMWINLYFNSYIRKKKYTDAWKSVDGTK